MDEKIYNQKYLSFKESPSTKEWCRMVQRSNFAKEMANYEVQGNKTIIENPKYLGHKYKIHTCGRVAEEVTKEKDIVT